MAATKSKPKKTSKGVQLRIAGLAAKVTSVETPTMRSDFPEFNPGDTVRVQVRIKEGEKERIQAFEGTCIAKKGKGGSKAFTVRKSSHGVGVERMFLESSPKIAKIEVVQKGRVRRAKLYYIRGLEGKAARIEREVETKESVAQKVAAAEKLKNK